MKYIETNLSIVKKKIKEIDKGALLNVQDTCVSLNIKLIYTLFLFSYKYFAQSNV